MKGVVIIMNQQRMSGVVLHITSLPGPHGIGTLGAGARKFCDFLEKAGQSVWQILPLSPTGFGDSPYQSCSAMAGNPYLIDLDMLIEDKLLTKEEVAARDFGDCPDAADYGLLYQNRLPLLRGAYQRGKADPKAKAFYEKQKFWLPDYALYMALKESYNMAGLADWPDKDVLARKPAALKKAQEALREEIDFHMFIQYLFFKQWKELKAYAAKRGILIFGDLPIYVAEDSVEVWTMPELFQLKSPGKPSRVAGVPPDFYSETGQLWGNPLYEWKKHEDTGYKWWLERLKFANESYDIIRIDHFRAFHTYWSVAANAKTAMGGKWVKGPGMPFVEKIKAALPPGSIIAEDLGDLGAEAVKFFSETGLPGMKVLVYAFDPNCDSTHLPHNAPLNSVCYTSTHDSNTFVGWLTDDAGGDQRELAFNYLRLRESESWDWGFGAIKGAWGSPAFLAMAPFQDVIGLGSDARINSPSTLGGNWSWRVREEAFNDDVAGKLLSVTKTFKR
jgi:4-alpha-glucanotransferase